MRYLLILAITTFAGSVSAAPDLAECRFADPPTVIEGITATSAQMADMGERVRAYLSEMNTSLACLDAKEAALGGSISPQDKAFIDAVYNQGVDQMQVIAKGYNDQLDVFKYKERLPLSDRGVEVIRRGDVREEARDRDD